jgi:hypothetical protein
MIYFGRTIITVALVAGLIACDRAPVHSTADNARLALDLITEARLREHVEYLADDARFGRKAGEPGYDEAAQYVVEQFEAIGISPGGVDGWLQPVMLRSYKPVEDGAKITIHRDGQAADLRYRDDYAMSPDVLRESTSTRAEVVYVGFGVHAPAFAYSDYSGIDVRGKIVAFFRGAPDMIEGDQRAHYISNLNKSKEAASRGAVGIIHLRNRKTEGRRPWAEIEKGIGKTARRTWASGDGRAANYLPEILVTASLNVEAGERLFGVSPLSFEEAHEKHTSSILGSSPLNVEVSLAQKSEHASLASPNVIGVVRGTDANLRNEYVVYTAHLDHVGVNEDDEEEDVIRNGAYDNAMGVALMIETARAIAAAPPKRSVMFIALTAEESGLLGSDYFVHNPPVPIDAIVANINLDMPLFLFPVADLVAFGSQHSSLQAVAETAAADEGFFFSPDPLPEENLFMRSDQYSFVKRGIPAVFLISGFNSTDDAIDGEALFRDYLKNHYHKPSDDMSRPIHWESAVRFARAHTRMGYAIAVEPQRPSWNEDSIFGDRTARD